MIRFYIRPLLTLVAAFAFAESTLVSGWPLTYSAPEIRARVVDEQTGAPLEGAVVLARWALLTALIGGNSHYDDNVHEFETTTDADGWFVIPAWGPRVHSPNSHLTKYVPQFLVFKSGYYGKSFSNQWDVRPEVSTVVSDWSGKTMGLRQFDGDWKTYAASINSLWSGSMPFDCLRSCPRMVLAVYAEWDRITPLVPADIYRRQRHPPLFRTLPSSDREFLEQFGSHK